MKEITTKKQAKEFCDKYINLVNTTIAFYEEYDGKIAPCIAQQPHCHIYSGLKKLASLLEIQVYKKSLKPGSSIASFEYNGVEFFQLNRGGK
ncbi:MAG: hypothetical protein RR327_04190 [Clostridia bacterium]